MAGMLYLVPTPIGNLGDISQRCRETLEQADFIAAEDTRVSLKLLNHLGIKKPLVSYYEHNRIESGQRILERMLNGEVCALVSDAGSPARAARWSCRLFLLVDRKPSKQNRPVGRPDILRAVMTAQGPGMAETTMPLAAHRATRSSPGSEIAGEPASDTRAQTSPFSIRSRIRWPLSMRLCS